jgi:uncharacterized protein YdeI (YjbR/CyaY-like superfamily)
VEVEIELDTEPREVSLAADFAAALDGDGEARRYFDGLSYSHKRQYVTWIEEARKLETRQRRIAQALSRLHEGRT